MKQASVEKSLVIKTLEKFEDELGTDIPVSTVLLMLKLPTNSPVSMTQLVTSTSLSTAGISRTMGTLAGFQKNNRRVVKQPYVTIADDPVDRRYKTVTVTDYGKKFLESLFGV